MQAVLCGVEAGHRVRTRDCPGPEGRGSRHGVKEHPNQNLGSLALILVLSLLVGEEMVNFSYKMAR